MIAHEVGRVRKDDDTDPRAQLEDVAVTFRRNGRLVAAVRGVDLAVGPAEILAVVGESGSGKSVLGLTMLGLVGGEGATVHGTATVCGVDMIGGAEPDRRRNRRLHLGAVFQDPMTSLNPTMRVGRQIEEAAGSADEARRLLDLVRVPDAGRRMRAYPHELSGGLRQRVMIAIAMAGAPQLVVADEPTTALDVTVQAQILTLLSDLRDEVGCSIVLITHDFGVAAQISDRVAVMYGGRLVESGEMAQVLDHPSHHYTAGLLRSRLQLDLPRGRQIATLAGEPPDPRRPSTGCPFSPRCPARLDACDEALPTLRQATTHTGVVACIADPPGPAGSASMALDPGPVSEPSRPPAVRAVGLSKHFPVRTGAFRTQHLHALRSVDLEIASGESVAVVGESGSGKSTLLRVVAGLIRPDAGQLNRSDPHPQMVFQDAGASLTPWLTVGELLSERVRDRPRAERRALVRRALDDVGLPAEIERAKPHGLSGGQRQRVGFARATIVPPQLLLCDEPTSALDASLAGSVLNLLQRLRREHHMAVMFVTHDLAVARLVGDRIAVMYLGEIVETGVADEVVRNPRHPYTRALLAAVPRPGFAPAALAGDPPSAMNIGPGCAFVSRCSERVEACSSSAPPLTAVAGDVGRSVACFVETAVPLGERRVAEVH